MHTFGSNRCNLKLKSPSQDPPQPHRSIIADLWHRFGQLRRTWKTDRLSLFRAWNHYAHIRGLKKSLDKSCRQAKRVLNAVEEASQAALQHDIRTVSPFRAIRLCAPGGTAQSAAQECSHLEEHFKKFSLLIKFFNRSRSLQIFLALPGHLNISLMNQIYHVGIPLPLHALEALWHQQYQTRTLKWSGATSNDILHQFDIHAHYEHI